MVDMVDVEISKKKCIEIKKSQQTFYRVIMCQTGCDIELYLHKEIKSTFYTLDVRQMTLQYSSQWRYSVNATIHESNTGTLQSNTGTPQSKTGTPQR